MQIQTVMMIDDEEDLLTIGRISLRNVGKWNAIVAANAAEALRLLDDARPDVILLDVMMPDIDGISLFKLIREKFAPAPPPVIFMTAKIQKHEVDSYLLLGAAGVVGKPFDPMRLPRQIREIVGAGQ